MVCLDTAYVVENWKCCSKIIFKCVNSAVEPIFNESFVEKKSLWIPWTVHRTHWLLKNAILQKKKKKCRCKDVDAIQMHTKCVFGKN